MANGKPRVVQCNESTVSSIQTIVSDILRFIEIYKWIIDAYVSDFFVKSHWNNLPQNWRQTLQEMEPQEYAKLLTSDRPRRVWPLSLLAFRECTQMLSLCREMVDVTLADLKKSLKVSQQIGNEMDTEVGKCHESGTEKCDTSEQCSQYNWKHVKPKKLHEIQHLGKIRRDKQKRLPLKDVQTIEALDELCCCGHVVDVGAGQGHLSRILAFQHGFKVTTIEADGCHAPKAKTFDRDAQKQINRKNCRKKIDSGDEIGNEALPQHVTCFIQSDTTEGKFLEIVQQSFNKDIDTKSCKSCSKGMDSPEDETNFTEDFKSLYHKPTTNIVCGQENAETMSEISQTNFHKKLKTSASSECFRRDMIKHSPCEHSFKSDQTVTKQPFILTGLHACGDLSTTMLRVFTSCPEIQGLASVACCYMKLTQSRSVEMGSRGGYPMSQYLSHCHQSELSYEAKEMACHFIDSYKQRLLDNPPILKLHAYRAALQWIIGNINPSYVTGLRKLTIRKAEDLTFQQYAEMGLRKLGLQAEISQSLLQDANQLVERWKDVVIFYTLRLSLAPVVETLILLDRLLFLHEKGFPSVLAPIFNPLLSPRNCVILSCQSGKINS